MRLPAIFRALLFTASAAFGQGPAPPSFEVASVKVNTTDPRQRLVEGPSCANGRFVALGEGVRGTILWAFNIPRFDQVAGLPQWAAGRDVFFDIEAKAGGRIDDGPVGENQCRLMVQKLLADSLK
jgi:uncharacterized protein (TIGR03435 family)